MLLCDLHEKSKKNQPPLSWPNCILHNKKVFFRGGKVDSRAFEFTFRRLRRNQMILANTLFQCVCYHPEEFQIITSGTDRKVGCRQPSTAQSSLSEDSIRSKCLEIAWGGVWG